MPKLYGRPSKPELRARIRRLEDTSGENRRVESENYLLKIRLGGEIERREHAEQTLSDLKKKLLELADANTEVQTLSRNAA
jgi:hypothetical protein